MTLLVTGASGLLGSHVVAQLTATGHRVLAAVMAVEQDTYKPLPGVQVVLNDDLFAGRVQGIDVVINCAFSRSNNAADLASGIDFTERLLRGLEACRVGAVINISSQGVYKRLPVGQLSTEQSPVEPMDLYSMAKFAVEKLFLCSRIPYKTNIRLASLNMRQRFLYKFVQSAKQGQPIALNAPNAYASILDVNDAARALIALAGVPADQWADTYNVGLGTQYSLGEYAQMVRQVGEQLGYTPAIECSDNGNTATAGMSIDRIRALTAWQPQVSTLQIIKQWYELE